MKQARTDMIHCPYANKPRHPSFCQDQREAGAQACIRCPALANYLTTVRHAAPQARPLGATWR